MSDMSVDKSVDEFLEELESLTVPSTPVISEYSKRLLEDVKIEIKNNPSNYSRERFLNEIQQNYYDDKPKIQLIHELEEYGLYPLIRNVLLGKYSPTPLMSAQESALLKIAQITDRPVSQATNRQTSRAVGPPSKFSAQRPN